VYIDTKKNNGAFVHNEYNVCLFLFETVSIVIAYNGDKLYFDGFYALNDKCK